MCVNIASQDGRYEARRGFSINGVAGGDREVSMNLSQSSFLSRYDTAAVGLLVTLGDGCPDYGKANIIAVAAWAPPARSGAQLMLLVNVGQNQSFVTYADRAGKKQIRECTTVSNSVPRVAFSKQCKIPLTDIGSDTQFFLDEYDVSQWQRTTEFRVRYGATP